MGGETMGHGRDQMSLWVREHLRRKQGLHVVYKCDSYLTFIKTRLLKLFQLKPTQEVGHRVYPDPTHSGRNRWKCWCQVFLPVRVNKLWCSEVWQQPQQNLLILSCLGPASPAPQVSPQMVWRSVWASLKPDRDQTQVLLSWNFTSLRKTTPSLKLVIQLTKCVLIWISADIKDSLFLDWGPLVLLVINILPAAETNKLVFN